MNDLAELERFRAELPDAPAARASARRRLVNRTLVPQRRSHAPVLARRRLVLVTAAAVVAAGGLVAVDTLVLGDRPAGASAEAASLLEQAAERAIGAADPVVGPDEYLRVTTVAVYATMTVDDSGPETYTSWLDTYTEELFVPGDPDREWVLRRSPRVPYRPVDAELAEPYGLPEFEGFTERARGGGFFGEPVTPSWQTPTAALLADLPRDPERLLQRIRHDAADAGPSRDGEALVLIADVLRSGVVPGGLRAALFRAAALIPGVELVDEQANLNGQVGVAVGRYEPNSGHRQEIIFEPDTGMVIGERQVLVDRGYGPHLPVGSAIAWTAVATAVVPASEVDEIPADRMD
jgi:RNA polymerase sigma-70 factor (ECF subfamily)